MPVKKWKKENKQTNIWKITIYQSHDLFEQLIESLIGVGDDEGSLFRKVVVQVRDDLNGHVSFAGSLKNKIIISFCHFYNG